MFWNRVKQLMKESNQVVIDQILDNERERTNHYGGNEEKARKYFARNN